MNLHIGWPQGIYLALHLFGVGYTLAEKDKTVGGYIGTVVASAITLGLLYWGGFFG